MTAQLEGAILAPVSPTIIDQTFRAVLRRVYLWMAIGLSLTAVVAATVVNTSLVFVIASTPVLFYGLLIGELLLVIGAGAALRRLSSGAALTLFLLYAAVNGATLSVLFLVYTLTSISYAFWVAAGLFALMSVIGYTTKMDLSRWGGYLTMGLIGFILASVVNIFFASSALYWITTYVGIVLFLGLTVYDTQRIKGMTEEALMAGRSDVESIIGLTGALRLYLDFINLFLLMLRVLGRRRR
ncbi:MAG: Bax inhibitor-1 family protein [Anaerolineales bacterium]